MEYFKEHIWQWNNETFGNIFWRKKRCKARLMGVQNKLLGGHQRSLLKLETKLMAELNEILTQEEIYWK